MQKRGGLSRRDVLRAGVGAVLAGGAMGGGMDQAEAANQAPKNTVEPAESLTVSVVQFRSTRDLDDNVKRHCKYVQDLASEGTRVVVFPECSVTGYFNDVIEDIPREWLAKAEAELCKTAKEADSYIIAGIPTKTDTVTYNSAIVVTPEGRILERYHKVHLAGEPWAVSGNHISVFPIDGILCCIIVCHDERYPELVRLPVIAGARVLFYISHESGLEAPNKIEPYRAQIMARAVENQIFAAHANAPAEPVTNKGSNGHSRLINSSGNIIKEAGVYDEEVVTDTFEMKWACGDYAGNSANCAFMKDWFTQGIKLVKRIEC